MGLQKSVRIYLMTYFAVTTIFNSVHEYEHFLLLLLFFLVNTWKSVTPTGTDLSDEIRPPTTDQHCFSKYANDLWRLCTPGAHFN